MKLALDQYALDARYIPEPHVPESAMRSDTCVESESAKRAKESGVRDRRYSIRHPFAAQADMLELKSGSRVSGVTSDLSSEDVSCVHAAPWRSAPGSAQRSRT